MQLLLVTGKLALKSLLANTLRSFLATLGIIFGVAAVIAMLAIGAGAQQMITDRFAAMGTNLLVVRPGAAQQGGVRGGARQTLKLEDAEAILAGVEGLTAVSPVASGRAQVKCGNQNTNTTFQGVATSYPSIRNFQVARGRFFTAQEEERGARVAVLGPVTAEALFGQADPLGETVRVRNLNFRVAGVLASKGDQGWFNQDDLVLLPYACAMKDLLGQSFLSEIDVSVADKADMAAVQGRVAELLRKRHRLRPDVEDDFNIRNQAEMMEMASASVRTIALLLIAVACISLLVGGIGIMNIMLVTVTERTREIGVRKAIGARDRDILRQFLLEAVLICGLGGLAGIALGWGAALLYQRAMDYQVLVQWSSVALSFGVAVSVGVFFGWMPARRAAKLDPIVALRYE